VIPAPVSTQPLEIKFMSEDFLKEYDGGVQITMATPADIGGGKVSTLKLREPTVRDLEAAQKSSSGDEAANEIQLFANLLEITVEEVRALKVRNYRRVQEGYKLFTS
jgi:hypothetical protein